MESVNENRKYLFRRSSCSRWLQPRRIELKKTASADATDATVSSNLTDFADVVVYTDKLALPSYYDAQSAAGQLTVKYCNANCSYQNLYTLDSASGTITKKFRNGGGDSANSLEKTTVAQSDITYQGDLKQMVYMLQRVIDGSPNSAELPKLQSALRFLKSTAAASPDFPFIQFYTSQNQNHGPYYSAQRGGGKLHVGYCGTYCLELKSLDLDLTSGDITSDVRHDGPGSSIQTTTIKASDSQYKDDLNQMVDMLQNIINGSQMDENLPKLQAALSFLKSK